MVDSDWVARRVVIQRRGVLGSMQNFYGSLVMRIATTSIHVLSGLVFLESRLNFELFTL